MDVMNRMLLDAPLALAKTVPLVPSNDFITSAGTMTGVQRTTAAHELRLVPTVAAGGSGHANHLEVSASRRIGYANLTPHVFPNAYSANVHHWVFKQMRANVRDWVPCYFLPWHAGDLVSLTIPQRHGAPVRGWDDTDPPLFFTAAINGCTVFVTGNRQNPTVYHGGINDDTQMADAVTHWRNLLDQVEGGHRASHDPTNTFGEANKTDYIKKTQQILKKGRPSSKMTSTTTRFRQYVHDTQGKNVEIVDMNPWGAVFGIRDDAGMWTFYLQENCVITVAKRSWRLGKWTETTFSRPLQLRQFYPGVGTHTVKQRLFHGV